MAFWRHDMFCKSRRVYVLLCPCNSHLEHLEWRRARMIPARGTDHPQSSTLSRRHRNSGLSGRTEYRSLVYPHPPAPSRRRCRKAILGLLEALIALMTIPWHRSVKSTYQGEGYFSRAPCRPCSRFLRQDRLVASLMLWETAYWDMSARFLRI